MQAHLNEETSLHYLYFTPAAVSFLEIALEIDVYCLCAKMTKEIIGDSKRWRKDYKHYSPFPHYAWGITFNVHSNRHICSQGIICPMVFIYTLMMTKKVRHLLLSPRVLFRTTPTPTKGSNLRILWLLCTDRLHSLRDKIHSGLCNIINC